MQWKLTLIQILPESKGLYTTMFASFQSVYYFFFSVTHGCFLLFHYTNLINRCSAFLCFFFSATGSKNEESNEIPFLPLHRLATFLESLPSGKYQIFWKWILYEHSQSETLFSDLVLDSHLKCYSPMKFFSKVPITRI